MVAQCGNFVEKIRRIDDDDRRSFGLCRADEAARPGGLDGIDPAKDTSSVTCEGRVDLASLDRQLDCEYLPMNVFVDPTTMKTHFQGSLVRDYCAGKQPGD
jgi:hypothetical protein